MKIQKYTGISLRIVSLHWYTLQGNGKVST